MGISQEFQLSEPSKPLTGYLKNTAATFFGIDDFDHYRTLKAHVDQSLAQTLSEREHPTSGILPGELLKAFQPLDLDVPLNDFVAALEELKPLYLDHAILFHHQDYVAHLNCPILDVSLAAEHLASALNTAVETWDQSAGGTWIEQHLINWLAKRAGLPEDADGVFTSGGSQSNLMAMLLAREQAFARADSETPHQRLARYRVLCSEDSHFSIQQACMLLGMGKQAAIQVPCTDQRCMDVSALEASLAAMLSNGEIPIAIVATAGTTDFGAIDPLVDIARLSRQYQCHFHVDAAYGGGLLLSKQQRQRLAGIEAADSVTLDFHKFAFQPVACSALLVRDTAMMAPLAHHADYLNPLEQALAGTPDLVNKSLQTTRRFDALKLWVTLRTLGPDALGEMIDTLVSKTAQLGEWMVNQANIELLAAPSISTLVFRFHAPRLDDDTLDEVNRQIRSRLARSKRAMVAATRCQGRQYLKFTLLNPRGDVDHLARLVADVVAMGHEVLQQMQSSR
ncbi:pyridoxal phosphate-dependent decarboxylase family protein [Carnimonas bestiolae]|uniref:pyridoxal phosphate-dependent decarboxylase family protein n=1 Tax=Carnimonas bestiolae TaxID=3402172 RepID=UPI003EDB8887